MTNKANEDIQYKKPVSLQRAAANLVAVFSYPDTSRPEGAHKLYCYSSQAL